MYKVVASFFDGFSGTMISLDKLGITPDEYHAFEIDPYSSAVSKYNYPNGIWRHGDARNWEVLKGKKIDFKLPIKLFGQDEDLLLEFNHLFYPDNDSFKPNFTIAFKEKK